MNFTSTLVTLVDVLREKALRAPEDWAYTFLPEGEAEGARLTWGELDGRARAIAAVLQERGLGGERILLLFPPGLDFVAAFFGCLYAGAVAVPCYPPRSERNLSRLLSIADDASPRAALTCAAVSPAIPRWQKAAPELERIAWIDVDALPPRTEAAWLEPGIGSSTLAFLQYTSGSTSTPKGVMVSHGNLVHNELLIQHAFGQRESSLVVGWLPLYHDMGLIGNVLQPLWSGASCVLMPPLAFLQKPRRWLEAVHRYRATTSGGPNFAYELCLQKITPAEREGLDLSSWRVAFNGAEPVRAATQERFAEAFAPWGFRREAFYPCYGLAEATLFVSGGVPGEPAVVREVDAEALAQNRAEASRPGASARFLVSCGRPWLGQTVAVVDPETGVPCEPGRVGEVWVAGESVAGGYWNLPEETASSFGALLPGSAAGPFLRTGDLGFVLDGELYITGRLKDLVILRGRNHYPQDLELTAERSHRALLPGCGAAFSVEVEGEERLVVVQEVERHAGAGVEEVADAVRQAIAEEHEVQVHEVVLARFGAVPRTTSGKVQRRLCRSLYLQDRLPRVGSSMLAEAVAAPGAGAGEDTPESFLRRAFARLARIEPTRVAPDRPLTALGLDSLMAVELKASVEAEYGVSLPLASSLEGASVRELAGLLARRPGTRDDLPLLKPGASEAGDLPLSEGQKALWFLERLAPEAGAYNIAVAARALGGLDAGALRRAFEALVLRHSALRSVFLVAGRERSGEPVRRVLERPEIDFRVENAAGWSEDRLQAELSAEAWRPFDLGRGPLVRARIFDRGAGGADPVLLLVVHHIAADFASFAVAARELAEGGGPPLRAAYGDFVRWQEEALSGPRGERLWSFWREALAGVPDLDLPADRPRPPVQTWRGGARTLELPPSLVEGARALAAAHGATPFMVLLAAFQAQLGRISGQDDLAVGTPIAGRSLPELAPLMGYFVNPVALRTDLSGEPVFAELLGRVRRTAIAGLEHGDFPFARVAERLRPVRDPSRSPLFQAMFLLQGARPGDPEGMATFALGESGGRLSLGGLELESLRIEERRAQLDLTLRVAEEGSGRLRASLEFNTDLFDAATAERMLGHWQTLLAGAVADPSRPVALLPLLTPAEREQLLVTWNASAADHPRDLLLHQLFEAQAARTPAAEALVAGTERLTYQELNRRANQLARYLQTLGVGPEVRVGVQLDRGAELIVALLAVLKAGGAYVPLDPKYPQERLELMRADSGARVVIEDVEAIDLTAYAATDLAPAAQPGNLAYLIYTSGSTGRPKAVALEHRSPVVLVQWARRIFSDEELSGVLASTSTAFDLSVFEIFVPLSWGGRVILAENALELPRLAAAGEVRLVNTVPSALAELVRSGGLPSSVRTINLAGEPVPPALVDAVYAVPGIERLYNLYGPSEDTTYSTFTRLAAGQPVTIGRPLDETRAYVLDARLELVPEGVPGELYLGGAGLARGYLGRPELTAERFVPDPFGRVGERLYRTGDLVRWRRAELEFLGR
ncbi:MAG TPA: amino acid adenylation domain-containing protein, partial [Thermoanaerobaculia bacterium]|nr:amino acid adenylation domain-containing protein [Thermoanaerobaculia bacterium]